MAMLMHALADRMKLPLSVAILFACSIVKFILSQSSLILSSHFFLGLPVGIILSALPNIAIFEVLPYWISCCSPSTLSASTANFKLLMVWSDITTPWLWSVANAMTTSNKTLKRRGKSMQPSRTPTMVSNQSSSTRTALSVLAWRFSKSLTFFWASHVTHNRTSVCS